MSFFSKAGSFALNTSTGNQSVSGLGFTPKIVLFVTSPDTADITTDVANFHQYFGAATDSTNQFSVNASSINGQDVSDSNRISRTNRIFTVFDPPGASTIDYEASFVTMDADGFTINVIDAPGVGYKVGYLALGGSDLSAKIATFTPSSSAGTKTVTGVGFQPKAVLLASVNDTNNAGNSPSADAIITLGFGAGSASASISGRDTDAQGTSSARSENSNQTFDAESTGGSGTARRMTLTSFDSDGFTLNQDLTPTTGRPIWYIALGGTIQANVGSSQLPTSTGTVSFSGMGFQPKAVMFMSICTNGFFVDVTTRDQYSIGFATGPADMFHTGGLSLGSQGTTSNSHTSSSSFVYRKMASVGTSISEALAFDAFTTDGFVGTLSTASATNSYVHYLMLGAAAGGGGGGGGGTGGSSPQGFAGTMSGFGDEF